jgi:hypothetical protein
MVVGLRDCQSRKESRETTGYSAVGRTRIKGEDSMLDITLSIKQGILQYHSSSSYYGMAENDVLVIQSHRALL